ncbi:MULTISPECIES: dihydrolipoamide acetyltransferase family protein [Prauserella salsuginis group]|uniref:Dihydrolipoamide acetyltransferase component of pyruvate dehydrogenase complex n=1 Tax=Prauserella salsuginis TaxID=387889 RepID=A0ABW6G0Z1_9PSEU|nr:MULTISPECIES: dihydrolipoamide acetyltransferase family protein [Prauserella salsuginis group]MCR3722024.1 pyruvate dehydrogenase E2 component (dihydrolipoamide acetyltransferase) [Prauserella flava]MCR3736030.1 pyruvate dehydrogenase E2 component (dihydrolipoamide acetyltransferase) [Prauserella salsuginis]
MSEEVFTLPDLGEGLTEATLLRWLVTVGDVVAVDAPVAEVETAKASVEVPSPFEGRITQLHGDEGVAVQVGQPLITVDVPSTVGEADSADADRYVEEERAGSGNVLIGYGTGNGPGRRRRTAKKREPAPQPSAPADAGAQASTAAAAPPRRPVQSPIVRKLARERGVDLSTVAGSGPGGLITRSDVEAAGRPTEPAASQAASHAARVDADTDGRTGLPIHARVPLTGLRKAVADTLSRSRSEIPEATTWVDVDATELLELRRTLGHPEPAPGILAMVARFVVAGLTRFPELNSRVDTERQEITHFDGINLGLAAQTDRGLMVPAVRNAHRLGMRGLDTEIRRLTTAARDGTVQPDELTTSSFTLNNYGVLGVDGSAAIINHPEVAILGMGRIIRRPWVVDDEVVPRSILQLSLAFDHRVCDGGTAGGFLGFVADAIESPVSALAEL